MEEEYRKPSHRRTVDHGNSFARWIQMRSTGQVISPQVIRPEASYIIDLLPPPAYQYGPRGGGWVTTTPSSAVASAIPTKFVHTSINKIKHPVLCVAWTPEGRRLVTGSMSGEFTLWNGMSFNFETIMQAHEGAVRSMKYSHNGDWLLSGDQYGIVKFWQTNFNNVRILEAHREMVRDIAFSPNDTKFITASDDGTVKIWDFSSNNDTEERILKGHGWDVRCVDWHPTLGLVVSGSKDNLVKLWDPRNGQCVSTFHGFKNTVTKTQFQPSGTQRLLASASRDQTARIMDLRMMGNNSKAYTNSRGVSSKADETMDLATGDKSYAILRGHDADVSALTWHPTHSSLISTGTHQGALCHYLIDSTPTAENTNAIMPTVKITAAHDSAIWDIEYHPLGHLLCSGASDRMARFWCRSRPGDPLAFKDKYYDINFEQPSSNIHSNNIMNNNNMNNTNINNNTNPNNINGQIYNNNNVNNNIHNNVNNNVNNNINMGNNNNRGNYNNRENNYNKHGDNRSQNNYQNNPNHNNQNNNNNYNRNRNYNNSNYSGNNHHNNNMNNGNNKNYNNNNNTSNIYSSFAFANDGMVRDGLSANVYEGGMMPTTISGEGYSTQGRDDQTGQNSGYTIPGLFRN